MSMTDVKQHVRRDTDLSMGCRLFFCEVAAMHESGGCYAGDLWLADCLGASESSVRRWRKQLRGKGYLIEYERGDRRHLAPADVFA